MVVSCGASSVRQPYSSVVQDSIGQTMRNFIITFVALLVPVAFVAAFMGVYWLLYNIIYLLG